jgi:hypothetical protein
MLYFALILFDFSHFKYTFAFILSIKHKKMYALRRKGAQQQRPAIATATTALVSACSATDLIEASKVCLP